MHVFTLHSFGETDITESIGARIVFRFELQSAAGMLKTLRRRALQGEPFTAA